MTNIRSNATTKFYMDQANKIVDVLSEIVPTIYCDVFKDDFDVFMDGLWISTDEKHPPILDQSVLHIGETIQTLEKTKWKSLSKEKRMEWLKRMDLQALLKALLFRPESLKLFCEKNSLVESKLVSVLKSMINWRNYGVGHKSVFKYEQMNEAVFKLNILEPVWEFSDLLSRYYGRECEILRKTLQEIEKRMKLPETSVDKLVKLSKKSDYIVREVLSVLRVYVDSDGNVKGEDEKELVDNIKKLGNKEAIAKKRKEEKQLTKEKEKQKKSKIHYKRIRIAFVCSCVLLVAISVISIKHWNDKKVQKVYVNVGYGGVTKQVGIPKKDFSSSSKLNYIVAPTSLGEVMNYGESAYNASLTDKEALCATVLAINEYYAKKGCKFRTPSLQQYFDKQKWYINKGCTVESVTLSKEEMKSLEELNRLREKYRYDLGEGRASDYSVDDYIRVANKMKVLEKMVSNESDK